jgi:hypothetical protein
VSRACRRGHGRHVSLVECASGPIYSSLWTPFHPYDNKKIKNEVIEEHKKKTNTEKKKAKEERTLEIYLE